MKIYNALDTQMDYAYRNISICYTLYSEIIHNSWGKKEINKHCGRIKGVKEK